MRRRGIPWAELGAIAAGGVGLWLVGSALFSGEASADPGRSAGGSSGGSMLTMPTIPEIVWLPLEVAVPGHRMILTVTEDYLPPMRGSQLQAVADAHGALLPTRKLVDLVYQAAPIRLPFHAETVDRESQATIDRHLARIAADRAGRRGIARGQQKSYVLSNTWRVGRVVIYGGRYADGSLVQSLSGPAHADGYVDYSQGGDLVLRRAWLDGAEVDLAEVLQDPARAGLVSDEGVIAHVRYA
jgi:hypothetical protein